MIFGARALGTGWPGRLLDIGCANLGSGQWIAVWFGSTHATQQAEVRGGPVSWTTKLLVIATRPPDPDGRCDALGARAIAGPVEVTLVAPASAPRTARRVERAVKRLSDAG